MSTDSYLEIFHPPDAERHRLKAVCPKDISAAPLRYVAADKDGETYYYSNLPRARPVLGQWLPDSGLIKRAYDIQLPDRPWTGRLFKLRPPIGGEHGSDQ